MKAILFDLDGTLLPMDNEHFTKVYFELLAKKLAPFGYNPDELIGVIWGGVKAMVKNDGSKKNEEAFWEVFSSKYGDRTQKDKPLFDEFYNNEFSRSVSATEKNPFAKEAVMLAKEKADYVILATNPIFPRTAVRERLSWIDLTPEDFDFVTTYENSSYAKPNPIYYKKILHKFNVEPDNAFMIGNDVGEDIIPTAQLGINSYLVCDNPIGDITKAGNKGFFTDMIEYLKTIDM